jgi:hypothetical protein
MQVDEKHEVLNLGYLGLVLFFVVSYSALGKNWKPEFLALDSILSVKVIQKTVEPGPIAFPLPT